ncbi:MAG TPA: hypothetical protein VFP84_21655 [Kofleriaceae bacterium]|nr:hypothetical protein [Kofleriaceae bacterium]
MLARVLLLACLAVAVGCDKPDHDNIEKWSHTQKGPEKLKKALGNESIDADLSAHAAAVMYRRGDEREVKAAFEAMAPARRADVAARLAPRLWEIARVENEKDLPRAEQVAAKDALVRVRGWAPPPVQQQIDGYLIDWYCVASYEDRAKAGAVQGPVAMRLVGPPAAKRLMSVANSVIAAPGQTAQKNRVGDNLLRGLAATGSPEAVKYVLDVARMDRGDATLALRAVSALYEAYVDPNGAFQPADPAALVPNLPALADLAKDDAQKPRITNDAVALIRMTGAPTCLAPLVGMIGASHRVPEFKFVVANNALKCGGAAAILDVVHALPETASYDRTQVMQEISGEIAKLTPRDQVLAAARTLLGEKSTLGKWVAIETLAAMKSADDAPAIAALGTSHERLVGYWGDEQGKDDPTLGQRAKELAAGLGGK